MKLAMYPIGYENLEQWCLLEDNRLFDHAESFLFSSCSRFNISKHSLS
ncbi:hypothetical protein PAMA110636_00645 [Paenibacillus macerans]